MKVTIERDIETRSKMLVRREDSYLDPKKYYIA